LQQQGYQILLIGRQYKGCQPLLTTIYQQQRIFCFFKKGFLMYAEYNTKLFFKLLFTPCKAICAIDLDTIAPCYFAAVVGGKKITHDAHEWFTQQKEVITRPIVYKFWRAIERFFVPKIPNGYTVNNYIQQQFAKLYGVQYAVVRNIPVQKKIATGTALNTPIVIYQGAVNEGRSFETLIPAMQYVNAILWIVGEGNFLHRAKQLVLEYKLTNKVIFKGLLTPNELAVVTPMAYFGVTIFEATGANQLYSLANRFFDYMMAGIPQICVAYPEYEAINKEYGFAHMLPNVSEQTIAEAMNNLLQNNVLYAHLKQNAIAASKVLHWQTESIVLANFWKKVLI
jgi:glycosyltransferase involved in cell wall biosynthesis